MSSVDTVEFGTIEDPSEPNESLVCVCGCFYFYPSDENGFVLGDTTNTKEHLVPWPDTKYVHALCPNCGRLYSDEEIAETGKASVLKTIDLAEPTHEVNIKAHVSE